MRHCPCCRDNGSEEKHKKKKSCFLCLQEEVGGEGQNEGEMVEVSLRNICRYLKIKPESIDLKDFPNGEKTDIGKEDVSVILCNSCSSLTNNLSSLIAQMETIQILVTHELQVFNEIISANSGSELHSARIRNKKLADCADPMETRFLEALRSETKEKCSIKMKKLLEASVPKLHLKRLKPEPLKKSVTHKVLGIRVRKSIAAIRKKKEGARTPAVKSKSPRTPPVITTEVENDLPIVTSSSQHSSISVPPPPQPSSHTPPRTSSIKGRKSIAVIRKKKEGARTPSVKPKSSKISAVIPPEMENDLPNVTFSSIPESLHLPISVPPPPQPFSKTPARSSSATRRKLMAIRKKKEGVKTPVVKSKSSRTSPVIPPEIENGIPNVTFTSLSESLLPPISVLPPPQESTSSIKGRQLLHEICKRHIKKIEPSNRYHCSICEYTFLPKCTKFRTHMVNTHPDTIFASKRPSHIAPQHFNVICQRILIEESSHAGRKPSATEKQAYICKICNRKYNHGHDFRYHLVLEHCNIVEDKLLKQFPEKEAPPKEKATQNSLPRRGRPRKIIPSPKKKMKKLNVIWACSVAGGGCGRKFPNRLSLTKHLKESCSLIKNRKLWTRTAKQRKLEKRSLGRPELPTPKTKVKLVGSVLGKYCGKVETLYKGSSAYKCLVCKDFKKGYFKSVIHKHLVNVHPEKFFVRRKLPQLSQEKFKICCRKLLTLETEEATAKMVNLESGERTRCCTVCGWKAPNGFNYRFHLVLEHFDVLEGKLSRIQEKMVEIGQVKNLVVEGEELIVKERAKRVRVRKRKAKEAEIGGGTEEVAPKRVKISPGKRNSPIKEAPKKTEAERLKLVLRKNENGIFTPANYNCVSKRVEGVPTRKEEKRQDGGGDGGGKEETCQNQNGVEGENGLQVGIDVVEEGPEIETPQGRMVRSSEEHEEASGEGEEQASGEGEDQELASGQKEVDIPLVHIENEMNTEDAYVLSSPFYEEDESREEGKGIPNTEANHSYDFNTESTMDIEVENVFMSIVELKPDINQLQQNL